MKHTLLILTLLLLLLSCDLPVESSDATNKTVISDSIEYSLNIRTNVYLLHDSLSISLNVKNNSGLIKTFNFSNIQQLGFQLIDRNNNVSMFYPNIVAPALSSFTLNPNETKELNIESDFKNYTGKYITKGQYELSVFLLDNNSPKLMLDILVN